MYSVIVVNLLKDVLNKMKTKSLRKLLSEYGATSMVYSMFGITIAFVIEHLLCICMPKLPACTIALFAALICMSVIIKRLNNLLIRKYNNRLVRDAYDLAEQINGYKNVDNDVLKELLKEVRNSSMEQ